jgi:hypothetical protein
MGVLQRTNARFSMPPMFGSIETDESAEAIARLPNLKEWWCANPTYLQTEADGKLTWEGRVNGLVLRTPNAVQPVRTQGLNGRHTLEFDGTQRLDAVGWSLPTNNFSILVIKRLTEGSGVVPLMGPIGAPAGTKCLGYIYSSGIARLVNSAFASIVIDPSTSYDDIDATAMVTQGADGMSMWKNSVQTILDATEEENLDDVTFSLGAYGTGSQKFEGEISDVLIFDANYRAAAYATANSTLQQITKTWAGV